MDFDDFLLEGDFLLEDEKNDVSNSDVWETGHPQNIFSTDRPQNIFSTRD
jgi:hypothetical protein